MQITALTIYPIKGCAGQSRQQAEVTPQGLRGDREFAVVLDGKLASQKQLPALRRLQADFWGGDLLKLEYPGMAGLSLDVGAAREKQDALQLSLFGRPATVLDMGDAVAAWLSAVLAAPVRLVSIKEALDWSIPLPHFRLLEGQQQDKFVDTSPILLTNQASLDDLNARLDAPVPMDRFRANIVISGLPAYGEDSIETFSLSGITLARVAACERCTVTTMDQTSDTAAAAKEPLLTLSRYRRQPDGYAGGIVFGTYLLPRGKGVINLGDSLTAAQES